MIFNMAKVISDVKKQIATLMTSAFGFVAALQWNSAIKEWLKPLVENGSGAIALTESAVVVTIIAVIAIYALGRMTQ